MKLLYITILLFFGLYQKAFSQTNEKRPIASYKKEWKDTTHYRASIDSIKNINKPKVSMYKNVIFQKDTIVKTNGSNESKKENETILKSEAKKDENN